MFKQRCVLRAFYSTSLRLNHQNPVKFIPDASLSLKSSFLPTSAYLDSKYGVELCRDVRKETAAQSLLAQLFSTAVVDKLIREYIPETEPQLPENGASEVSQLVFSLLAPLISRQHPQIARKLGMMAANVHRFSNKDLNRILKLLTLKDYYAFQRELSKVYVSAHELFSSGRGARYAPDEALFTQLDSIWNTVERNQPEDIILQTLALLVRSEYALQEPLLHYLLDMCNLHGFGKYGRVIVALLEKYNVFDIYDEFLISIFNHCRLTKNAGLCLRLISLIVGPQGNTTNNLLVKYVRTYEDQSLPDPIFSTELGPENFVPPEKSVWTPCRRSKLLLFKMRAPTLYFRVSPENGETLANTSSWLSNGFIKSDSAVFGSVETHSTKQMIYKSTSAYTIHAAMLAASELNIIGGLEVLIRRLMWGSFFVSHDGQVDYLRVFTGNLENAPPQVLAANNLDTQSSDFERLFAAPVLEACLRSLKENDEISKEILGWSVSILESVYLAPFSMSVAESVGKHMRADNQGFSDKYNLFFDIEDIIKQEIVKRIPKRKKAHCPSDDVRKAISVFEGLRVSNRSPASIKWYTGSGFSRELVELAYSKCYELEEYELIRDMEDNYMIDFDLLVRDPTFRETSKKKIELWLRQREEISRNRAREMKKEKWLKRLNVFNLFGHS